MHLEKRIPVAAGLGGGSSDAGTLLKGLNACFGNEFDRERLIDLGVRIGADVPFFTTDMESAVATGIGEKLVQARPLADCFFILANPGIAVSTAEVFKKYALTRVDKNSTLTGFHTISPENLSLADLHNDLEEVTVRDFPVIAEIKEDMRRAGADGVLMSGSGPTVFGVFLKSGKLTEAKLEHTAQSLRQKYGEQIYTIR